MTGNIIRFPDRPREFYAVLPGEGGPLATGEPEPVFYAPTLNGLDSALAHALYLSRGNGYQYVTLTRGRETRIIRTVRNGEDITGPRGSAAPPYRTRLWPEPGQVREGSPRGHIPELCSHAKHKAAGTRPRKNPNCPKPEWPGIIA